MDRMDRNKDVLGMLDLMIRPGFCVKENKIVKVNQGAQSLGLTLGAEVGPMLRTGKEEYETFQEGALYLTLDLAGQSYGASVTRMENVDVFLVEQEADSQELRAMALAARELREPLSNVMITAERLFPLTALQDDPQTKAQVARLNRGLYQMLRVLGNMSDAARTTGPEQRELREMGGLFHEIFEKAQAMLVPTGLELTYKGLAEEVYGPANAQQLERAVLNILSNAVKFTPRGGSIHAELTRRGHVLRLSVQDSGSGIAEDVRSGIFSRYLRRPAMEDSRYGIGLGMLLIRSAASSHGGAVLIDQPDGRGTRVTMTMDLRRKQDATLRSPVLAVDYAGERDHWLVELAGCLPPEVYEAD